MRPRQLRPGGASAPWRMPGPCTLSSLCRGGSPGGDGACFTSACFTGIWNFRWGCGLQSHFPPPVFLSSLPSCWSVMTTPGWRWLLLTPRLLQGEGRATRCDISAAGSFPLCGFYREVSVLTEKPGHQRLVPHKGSVPESLCRGRAPGLRRACALDFPLG